MILNRQYNFKNLFLSLSGLTLIVLCVSQIQIDYSFYLSTKDSNWDLKNYHIYTPYSIINQTFFMNLNPGGIQTFNFPLIDFIYLPLHTVVPSKYANLIVIVFHISVQSLLYFKFYEFFMTLFKIKLAKVFSILIVFALFLSGLGVMNVSGLATTMGDNLTAYLNLFGLLFFLKFSVSKNRSYYLYLSSIFFTLSFTLKFTNAPFLLTFLTLSFFYLFRENLSLYVKMSSLSVFVFIIVYAPWGILLFLKYGNPFFPYFNALFKSPFFTSENFRDSRFGIRNYNDLFSFFLNSIVGSTSNSSEIPFIDYRWVFLIFLFATSTLLLILFKFKYFDVGLDLAPIKILWAFVLLTFISWGYIFGISRYVLTIELLFGLLLFCTMLLIIKLGLPIYYKLTICFILLGCTFLTITEARFINWGRVNHIDSPNIPLQFISLPIESQIVFLPEQPSSYLIPSIKSNEQIHFIGKPFNDHDFDSYVSKLNFEEPMSVIFNKSPSQTVTDQFRFQNYTFILDECLEFMSSLGDIFVQCRLVK